MHDNECMALILYMSRIQFETGAIAEAAGELSRIDVSRPLLITDPGVRSAGLVDRLLDCLPAGIPVFDATPSNPTEAAAQAALDLYRDESCDGLVALGGGSPIDLAKAVALLSTHSGTLEEYGILNGGLEKIGPVAPILAIPTTAGTGAEVGRAATLTMGSGTKAACVSPHLIPKAVICDPELTYGLPPFLTAATGMDALSHGIEAYLSKTDNPPAGAIALDCVARVGRNLERAVADGSNREARREMLMAALEGGLVLQKGLGAVHAMSHPLGALGLHHGTLNAVLLPAVLRFNEGVVRDKYRRLSEALALPSNGDLAMWVDGLNRRFGMPSGLREMGVRDDQLPALAEKAAKDHLSATNPRAVTADDYLGLLRDSL